MLLPDVVIQRLKGLALKTTIFLKKKSDFYFEKTYQLILLDCFKE